MQISNKLLYKEFVNRESDTTHADYLPELDFYTAIKSGDTKKVRFFCKEALSEKKGLGILSNNALQNMKYHFTITAALATRYCIEGGMDFKEAYTLSDYYILTADEANTMEELSELHLKMCLDYTDKMKQLKKKHVCSKPIAECIDYIYENLHTRITIDVLAKHVNLSHSYLSRLFKKETSMSITDYIRDKKIDTAKSMLQYSDFSIAEISEILAFPSQSYFTEVFHKHTLSTPIDYRRKHYRDISSK